MADALPSVVCRLVAYSRTPPTGTESRQRLAEAMSGQSSLATSVWPDTATGIMCVRCVCAVCALCACCIHEESEDMSNAITVDKVLRLIADMYSIEHRPEIYVDDVIPIKYDDYLREMILNQELTRTERKAKEMWNLLVKFGFIRAVKKNQWAEVQLLNLFDLADRLKFGNIRPGTRKAANAAAEEEARIAVSKEKITNRKATKEVSDDDSPIEA